MAWRQIRDGLFALATVLVAACAAVQIPRATETDVQRAAWHRPQTTLVELERGRSLYLSRCASCHRPVAPESVRATEWPGHVAEMKTRARLQPGEADLVVLYLVTMATPSIEHAGPSLGPSVERR